jgi:hypothetical protein
MPAGHQPNPISERDRVRAVVHLLCRQLPQVREHPVDVRLDAGKERQRARGLESPARSRRPGRSRPWRTGRATR